MEEPRTHDAKAPAPPEREDRQAVDLVDLGVRPLLDEIQVDPAPVAGSGGRRFRPGPQLVIATGIVAIALAALSAGLVADAPQPTGTPGASAPVAIGSPAPSGTVDPCTTTLADLPVPSAKLQMRGAPRNGDEIGKTTGSVDQVGFVIPVERPLEVGQTNDLWLFPSDMRCIDSVRIDLHGVSARADQSLAMQAIKPISAPRGGFAFSAPPTGDWVIRAAIHLRQPSRAAAPWVVFYFRVNVGYVAYESPQPVGSAGPSDDPGSGGQIIAPTLPCAGQTAAAWSPPVVELVRADGTTVGGTLGATVSGSVTTITTTDAAALRAIAMPFNESVRVHVVGDVCASNWHIKAGTFTDSLLLRDAWIWSDFSDNPANDLAVAAQNSFTVRAIAFGDTLLSVTLDFPGAHGATYLWRLNVDAPVLPVARLGGPALATPAPLSMGCGNWMSDADGATVVQDCVQPWPLLPIESTLTVAPGTALRLDSPGVLLTGWTIEYAPQSDTTASGEYPQTTRNLLSGWSESGLESVEVLIPQAPGGVPSSGALGPGDWHFRITVNAQLGSGTYYGLVFHVRIRVT